MRHTKFMEKIAVKRMVVGISTKKEIEVKIDRMMVLHIMGIAYRLRAMLEKILNYDLYSIKQNKPKRQKIKLIH